MSGSTCEEWAGLRATRKQSAHFDGAVMDKLPYAALQGLGADLKNCVLPGWLFRAFGE